MKLFHSLFLFSWLQMLSMKKFILISLFNVFVIFVFAQLKSPDDFLGYKIGSQYTPHWKIINYFQSIATAAPGNVKLQEYGKTNEGRPLMAAFISSAENK